ncbi:hypothetical protein SBRY_20613 [Actinacidiphila bryophytorum]|uniref:Uncharacterized protein n=1 Tax=Actinacidiphila bryophytorum TaxID=1436133 RepID=A0A9W4GYC2_9ACTN|nr:hypothetical protein SBRY_20613 [Actinacidiphila bryophytorum]
MQFTRKGVGSREFASRAGRLCSRRGAEEVIPHAQVRLT